MNLQTINNGTVPGDGTGDSSFVSFGKVNGNFATLGTACDTMAAQISALQAAAQANPPATLAQGILAERARATGAEQGLASGLQSANVEIASFQQQLSDLRNMVAGVRGQLAQAPSFYVTTPAGPPGANATISTGSLVTGNGVPYYAMQGLGMVLTDMAFILDPGSTFVAKAVFRRTVDPVDYDYRAECGVAYLDQNYQLVQLVPYQVSRLTVYGGVQSVQMRVPDLTRGAVPPNAVFFRPYVQTYDTTGVLGVQTLKVAETTFSVLYSPDVANLLQRISTLESQINQSPR